MESEGEREEMTGWQRKVPGFGQKWKGFLEEKKNFHLLSLHGLRVFSFNAGGPTGLCSVTEAFGVNETAVVFERCFRSAFLCLYGPVLTCLFSPEGNE